MKQHLFILLALCLLCTSCGGGGGSDDEPEISKDYINVNPSMQLLWSGDTQNITISSNCSWKVSVNVSWLTVNPTEGNNSLAISITAPTNNTGSERVGVLTIQGGKNLRRTVTVTQGASPDSQVEKTMTTSLKSLNFDYQESSKAFTITSNTTWTVTCPEWCSVTPASGSNNSSITVTAMANSSNESRTGTIEVKGENVPTISISVTQQGDTSGKQSEPGAGDNLPPSN